jgi:hypothetical protein
MNCRPLIFGSLLFYFTLSLGALTSRAQDEPQPPPDAPPDTMPGAPPKPAGYSFPALIGPGGGELQPDFSPLTGMQNTTLGIPEMRHSYWVPGIQVSSNVLSAPTSGGSNWYADNYFLGNLSLLEAWGRNTLAVNYSGGGFVATNSSQGGGYYQQLGLAQTYHTERWLFQIVDQFAYMPQSSFGFGGGTNLGIPGVGGALGNTIPGLGGNYSPNQSIYGVGPFYSNAAAIQASYAISRRTSITLAGSYGLQSFTQAGNIDSNAIVGSVGVNYALTPKDTIGLVYRYGGYHFPGDPQAYGDNVLSVAYGRKVTGRIGLRLFVGPQFTSYRIPIGGTSQTTGFSASGNLTYGFKNGTLGVIYFHGLSGGSGVLVGSELDQTTASYSRNLTRVWSGNINFGYARNSPVGGTAGTGIAVYDDWFIGGGVGRQIGRNFNLGIAYTAILPKYSQNSCTGSACVPSNNYQSVTISLQWHPRPFILR